MTVIVIVIVIVIVMVMVIVTVIYCCGDVLLLCRRFGVSFCRCGGCDCLLCRRFVVQVVFKLRSSCVHPVSGVCGFDTQAPSSTHRVCVIWFELWQWTLKRCLLLPVSSYQLHLH